VANVTAAWEAINGPIETVINWIRSGWEGMITGLTDGINTAKDNVTNAFQGMRDSAQNVVDSIVGFFNGLGDKIKNALSGAKDFINGLNPFGMTMVVAPTQGDVKQGVAGNRQNIVNIHTKDTPSMNDLAYRGFIEA
jgi:phage-related protein